MKKASILLLVLLNSFIGYGQQGYKKDLRGIATITFADTPEMKISGEDTVYMSVSHASGMVYLAVAGNAQKNLNELFTKGVLDTIYNDLISGTLKPLRGKLLYKRKVEINHADGIEFVYEGTKGTQKLYGFNRGLYLNNVIIDYGVLSTDTIKKDNKAALEFFRTFKLKIAEDDIRQSNRDDAAYRIGYILGSVGFFVVLGLMIVGIVLLIRRLTRRPKKINNDFS